MSECRNCGSIQVRDLGPIGQVQPFFLKRVLGMQLRSPRSSSVLKQRIRELLWLSLSPLSRGIRQFAYVDMQLCRYCGFVQSKVPFHDEEIMNLYRDYRLPSYDAERIRYEPEYADIAKAIGQDQAEVSARRSALGAFLNKVVRTSGSDTILDYGGSDGRFIPDIAGSKFVYEISSMEPVSGVTRIRSESELGMYSIVLLAHVTEHVPHPLRLARKLSTYVKPGGYLYIETPQELSDQERRELLNGGFLRDLGIHEHINYYCPQAVDKLLKAAGFEVVAIETAPIDLGWTRSVHIRALGLQPASS